MRALLPSSPATNRSQGAGARMAGLGSEEGFDEGCFQVPCSSNRTRGLSQGCPTGIQSEVISVSLKRPWIDQAKRHGSELQQNGLWSDCQDWIRLVVYPMTVDPFQGGQPGGRSWKSLPVGPLLQQLGLEVIELVARPPLALCFGVR